MIVDVVDAVAAVARAFGAVAEFQIGIIRVRAAADCTFVAVGALTGAAAVILCPVGIRLGVDLCTEVARGLAVGAAAPPALRQEIADVFAEKQEIVQQRNERELR